MAGVGAAKVPKNGPKMVPNHPKWGPGADRGSAEKSSKNDPKMAKKGLFRAILGGGAGTSRGGLIFLARKVFFFNSFFYVVFVRRFFGPKPGGITLLGVFVGSCAELAHPVTRVASH